MPRLAASSTPPTTRSIAARLGLSSATVSLALRNRAGIAKETCLLVQKTAKEMGYRPDPEVMKLMHHLRKRNKPRFQSLICALTTIPEDRDMPYIQRILASARERADALGYGFMVWQLEDAEHMGYRRDLQRILESRGVQGVLLAPLLHPRSLHELLDWSKFSVVAATNGVIAPRFHRVVPHQFNNMLMLCQELVKSGYRRLGAVLSESHDLTTYHAFSAAVVWQNFFGGTEFVRPLIYPDHDLEARLKAWFAEEKPDAIIDSGDVFGWEFARILGLRIPGKIGFANTHMTAPKGIAGVDERPTEIGATAANLLASMIQRGEKGVPEIPNATLVEGKWVPGPSIRPQSRRRAKNRSAFV